MRYLSLSDLTQFAFQFGKEAFMPVTGMTIHLYYSYSTQSVFFLHTFVESYPGNIDIQPFCAVSKCIQN